MKKFVLSGLLMLFFYPVFTQSGKIVSLQDCHQKARAHSPLSAQPALLQSASDLRQQQIKASRMPDLNLSARASYQSETVDLGIKTPLFSTPTLPLEQFRTQVDASYTLYDGGLQAAQSAIEQAALKVQQQSVEVELRKLNERINQPFFGVLLLREKIKVLENSREDLKTKSQSLEAAIRQGVRLPGDLERLRVQDLRLAAEIDKTRHDISGLLRLLESLTGDTLADDVTLQYPSLDAFAIDGQLNRPELPLFQLQQDQLMANDQLITARRKPKASAFLQLGLGYPNPLNFFEDELSPFALGGVQLTWKIWDWQQSRRDRELLTVQRQLIGTQQANFIQAVNQADGKVREDIAALEALISRQEEIAARQEAIRKESAAQLDQGVITVTDYLAEVNAGIATQLTLQTYRLQIQQIKIDYLTLKGLL